MTLPERAVDAAPQARAAERPPPPAEAEAEAADAEACGDANDAGDGEGAGQLAALSDAVEDAGCAALGAPPAPAQRLHCVAGCLNGCSGGGRRAGGAVCLALGMSELSTFRAGSGRRP